MFIYYEYKQIYIINNNYFSNINIQKKTINILNDDIWVIS